MTEQEKEEAESSMRTAAVIGCTMGVLTTGLLLGLCVLLAGGCSP